ncbi:hypothetical protein PA01_01035 [Azoarcus sp. PA01]|nr:hypothetical protein PA01_01035 [Azoarcus sp. PA01]
MRVPIPYNFHEGVLLMELVADENGEPAPQLNDIVMSEEDARRHHAFLVRQVVRMLCAGIVLTCLISSDHSFLENGFR